MDFFEDTNFLNAAGKRHDVFVHGVCAGVDATVIRLFL
jgi:hypothetical protein